MMPTPFHTTRGKPQQMSWKHLKDGKIYDFELILPFRSIMQEVSKEGAYMIVAAEAKEDQELHVMSMNKDQKVVLNIAATTFSRAWEAVSKSIIDTITEADNIRLKFKKDSNRSITILDVERMKPSPNHDLFAKKVYDNPNQYRKSKVVNVRKVQEL